ncbi:MAG: nucleoside deaminase [Bacteroidales bacterium]|nr:nucleoside deaminase [Bacteroidales bacterium]
MKETSDINPFMAMAIEEARIGIEHNHGGPFGSVIVKDGKVVGRGHNRVLADHDATCHGEISAIRDAGRNLGTHDLKGCTIYTTGEPCHMCLCACLWAKIDKIYYGCSIADNEIIGFRDNLFDKIFGGRDKLGNLMEQIDHEACLELFNDYSNIEHGKY